MSVALTFPGEPVPAARVRASGQGFVYTPGKYAAYKRALASAIRDAWGYLAWDIPPVGEATKRAKWIKANRYRLTVSVFRSASRGDWDNYGKTVSDALEQAGVIANDTQIDDGRVIKAIDKANPRVEFVLERI